MEKAFSKKMQGPLALKMAATTIYNAITKYIKIHYLFIILFGYTGAYKLLDMDRFKFTLWRAILIRPYYRILAYSIPIIELVIAVLLTFQLIKIGKLKIPSRTIGLYASFILMVAFTGYVGYSLAFSKGLPCTCGGIISQMTWTQHLIFNAIFSLLALRAIILARNTKYS